MVQFFKKSLKYVYLRSPIKWILSSIRHRMIYYLRDEIRDGSLSFPFKSAIYSQNINQRLEEILKRVPSQYKLRSYAPLLTEKIIVKRIESGLMLYDLVVLLDQILDSLNKRFEVRDRKSNNPKSIVFVTALFPAIEHGGGLKVFDIIQELNLKGFEVSLYSLYNHQLNQNSYNDLVPSLKHVRLVDNPTFSMTDFQDWLERKNLKFDIAHYVWPFASELIDSKNTRIGQHIFEFIETTTRRCTMAIEDMIQKKEFKDLGTVTLDLIECLRLESMACSKADKFICMTEKDSEFSRNLFGIPYPEVVQIGISKHAILSKLDSIVHVDKQSLLVGFIGNYNHYPNIEGIEWYLDSVHPIIKNRVAEYKFNVIGFGLPDRLINKYKDDPTIQMIGAVEDVTIALEPLSVCVAPLISGAGFRVKLNQFSILKKPTVSTTIGACGMSYADGDSILISDESEKFAESVIRLLVDKKLCQEMGNKAYAVVEKNYFWEPHIRKLIRYYEN